MSHRLIAAMSALVAAGLAACPGAPSTEVPSPRIVSLVPGLTDIVVTLGETEHLVGVTRYCEVEGVPAVGDQSPSMERILARRPELVLTGIFDSQATLRGAIDETGIETLALRLDGMTAVRAAIVAVGERLGRSAKAAELVIELDEAVATARRAADTSGRARVLLVFDVAGGHVYTTGGGDHLADLLDIAGAENVAAGGPLTTRLSLEKVLRLRPDVILHTTPSEAMADHASARRFWASYDHIPAVQSGRVYVWPDTSLARPGPRLTGLIDDFVALLHGSGSTR